VEEEAKQLIDEELDSELLDDIGEIHVADEVICIVASLAAQEVPGVYSMSGGLTDEINSFLGKENASKGVRIRYEGKSLHVIVYVVLEYGYCFPEVALSVQEKVKHAVEEMTGYEVQFVDVHVEGVSKPQKIKPAENQGSADVMEDIIQAQAERAEATEANSYEMQLRNNAKLENIEAPVATKTIKAVKSPDAAEAGKAQQSSPYEDNLLEEQYRERKYFQIGEENASMSADERHHKFWEED